MTVMIAIGALLALGGLGGVLWCMRHAAWLRKAELDDDAARAELNKLIYGHMAAIGAAFMGIGLVVMALLLS